MAFAKNITVKENSTELKHLLKKSKPLFVPRIRMLMEIKKNEKALSKNTLAEKVGVNHNSIQRWRKNYEKGGLDGLLSHKANASRPSVFSKEEHEAIGKKLNDPKNGLQGYRELQEWVEKSFDKSFKYNTLMKYCVSNFGSKIKVARKSNVKKDEKAVSAFKKTLVTNAEK